MKQIIKKKTQYITQYKHRVHRNIIHPFFFNVLIILRFKKGSTVFIYHWFRMYVLSAYLFRTTLEPTVSLLSSVEFKGGQIEMSPFAPALHGTLKYPLWRLEILRFLINKSTILPTKKTLKKFPSPRRLRNPPREKGLNSTLLVRMLTGGYPYWHIYFKQKSRTDLQRIMQSPHSWKFNQLSILIFTMS